MHLSYASPPVWKLYPCSDIISKSYKLTFLAIYFIAVLQLFRYSVFHGRDTPISVSTLKPLLGVIGVHHWNPKHLLYYPFVYKTSSYIVIC